MDTKSAGILGVCIIVAALIISLGLRPEAARRIHTADGSLAVDYLVRTSPTAAEGSTMERVTDIEFYPNYVVVKGQDGHGKVFFADRTQRLDWSLTAR